MDWQDYTVWGIVAAIGVLLVRRSVCLLRGRGEGGCTGCDETRCILRTGTERKAKP